MGFADHVRTGGEHLFHSRCGLTRRRVRAQPVRLAEAGARALDMEYVFHREREACERARSGSLQRGVILAAEAPKWVIRRCPSRHTNNLRGKA
jgi:hypothetical protein